MEQCLECGNFDTMGLGFCITCGKVLPKPKAEAGKHGDAAFSKVAQSDPYNYEQMRNSVFTGLMLVALTGLFILLYLMMNDTDPMLILIVESFPILWFFLILMQWRSIKGKSKNS